MEAQGAHDVQHAAAHTPAGEARGSRELLGGERLGDAQDALVGPVVIVKEFLKVAHAHTIPFLRPSPLSRDKAVIVNLFASYRNRLCMSSAWLGEEGW
jgi:hypothetical protein